MNEGLRAKPIRAFVSEGVHSWTKVKGTIFVHLKAFYLRLFKTKETKFKICFRKISSLALPVKHVSGR